jgi:glutamate synthase (NADPH/NADH) large chain
MHDIRGNQYPAPFRPPYGAPEATGLYDPRNEHDNCGVGFVAHIKGVRSRSIIDDADLMLRHMDHRGACGCEANTGDGAGMLTALPHAFLKRVAKADIGIDLPDAGRYGAGIVFLPQDAAQRATCKKTVEEFIAQQGQTLLGWRALPVDFDTADIGKSARDCAPHMEMLFVGGADVGAERREPSGDCATENRGTDTGGLAPYRFNSSAAEVGQDALERQLFIIRKLSSHKLRNSDLSQALLFYICSLSTKLIIYKGMLTSHQVVPFFKDLQAADYDSHLAMVHSRFATNTFPSWDRAQPLRFMSHNGEINTVKGNSNWMFARQGMMKSELFGNDIKKLFPIVEPHTSDSGCFDNALEMLYHSGRTLQEVVMMMVPEAWQNHQTMPEHKRAFYEYYSALQEPWDGPASISFTDGHYIGATLDRNGLRPSRYYVTKDDKVVMASEVGVLDIKPENVAYKGRLQPGRMFLVDFEQGRIIDDEELKKDVAARRPYQQWVQEQRIRLEELPKKTPAERITGQDLLNRMQAFGYTSETMQFMLLPLIKADKDPIGSMGNDAALACLSDQPRMLYDYFHQLFAQVTNPPIDSIREEVIMSLECYIGPEGNLLDTKAESCHRLAVPHPILTNHQMANLKGINYRGWKCKVIDITYSKKEGVAGLQPALDRICAEARKAIKDGFSLIVLSDRKISAERIPVSSLMATGAVHHHLVRHEERTQIGLLVESGEAREVHHFCLLIGFGADAVNPYLALYALRQARLDGKLTNDWDDDRIIAAYRSGVANGMLKVMAKMGISTLQSYKGAQIFEALGLADEVVDLCFAGTPSRIKGVGFDVLAQEAMLRHHIGFPENVDSISHELPNPGLFAWRRHGEKHAWNPHTIGRIQQAARTGDKSAYKDFSKLVNAETTRACHLRGLLKFRKGTPVPLNEVEPAADIVKRFCTGAMSFGSISADSHEALAIAMNRIGGKSNTGEGGERYDRFVPLENGDSKRSAIKQVASGRFGVTSYYLTNADELQIKIAQGAKPGEGGELPGHKVDKVIASTRLSTPGVGLISPPPHHDIYSIEDLSQLIFDLKNANRRARISVKLVSEVGVGTIASGVAKGHADNILISGFEGGTGASPLTSIKHAGLPWELGIAETHQTLVMNDLRSRVRLQTDGQLKTGRDVVVATMLGAEEYGFATAPLITLGCIMMRKCHLNTCPVGIATQDPVLRKKFQGKPEHVVNYLFMVAEETREIMAELGFRTINEMVGRVDMLELDETTTHWKAKSLNLSPILTPAKKPHANVGTFCSIDQNHALESVRDMELLTGCAESLANKSPKRIETKIQNTDRAFGTILSNEVSRAHGAAGLPADTIHIKVQGSAGQSVGAWLAPGVTIEVEGDANDYAGKGLSGGRLIVYPPKALLDAGFVAEKNIIIGNVALYGATSGEAYFRGVAAERFCVRNSGATAVIEGCGDHGLEYMTGGRAVVLGPTGRNFAAGMSGGVAYVFDPNGEFLVHCNLEMVELEKLTDEADITELKSLIENHQRYTGSTVAASILNDWTASLTKFHKVMPVDYKRALKELAGEKVLAAR